MHHAECTVHFGQIKIIWCTCRFSENISEIIGTCNMSYSSDFLCRFCVTVQKNLGISLKEI